MTPTKSGIALGPRRARRAAPVPTPPARPSGPSFRWLLLGAAVAVVLLMAGAVIGRLAPAAPTPTQGVGVAPPPTSSGDPGHALAELALILQGTDRRLATLRTSEGDAGGVVVVSPGSGLIAVVSSVLAKPPEGARYLCLLDRGGEQVQVGHMRWDPTADGGGLAYLVRGAAPDDPGQAGDILIVRLDAPDAQPLLTGEFPG